MREIKKPAKPIVSKEATLQLKLWDELKGKLKGKFSTLKESDLQFELGKKEEMFKKVQTKLGKTKEEFASIVATL
ncbi:MAG: general stress protein CsbD [Bacteroidota bacterium]